MDHNTSEIDDSEPSVKVARVVEIIYPAVTIDRNGSDLCVNLDSVPIATVHYVYGHIDNATQWRLAEQIAAIWQRR